MFIKNPSSIPSHMIIGVCETEKDYLVSLGISPLSRNNELWIFDKNKRTTEALNKWREVNN